MREEMRAGGYRGRIPSAAERLDEQWSRYMGWSLVAAIAFHAMLLVFWPKWNVIPTEGTAGSAMVQMEAVALLDADEGMHPEAIIVAAEQVVRDEPEPQPVAEPSVSRGPDLADLDRILASRADEVVVPVMARSSLDDPAELVLETMTALSPDVVLAQDFVLPVIRNPTGLTRFFRSRYNPIRSAVEGFVSIAMWIDERGAVGWAQVRESSGSDELDEIALQAFNEVVSFTPGRSEGAPVSMTVIISVPFNTAW
jgi:TonB family protein